MSVNSNHSSGQVFRGTLLCVLCAALIYSCYLVLSSMMNPNLSPEEFRRELINRIERNAWCIPLLLLSFLGLCYGICLVVWGIVKKRR